MRSRLGIPTLSRQCYVLKLSNEIRTSNSSEPSAGRCAFCARFKDRKLKVKCNIRKKCIWSIKRKYVLPGNESIHLFLFTVFYML